MSVAFNDVLSQKAKAEIKETLLMSNGYITERLLVTGNSWIHIQSYDCIFVSVDIVNTVKTQDIQQVILP